MRDKVFISYSRKDKKWLEQLKTWLKQFVREEKISIWDDTKIAPGANWHEEIKRALESTRVAVLLVSQDFLASDFIQADELPPLLKAEAKILWMAVRPCMYKDTVIARYQALNEPSKPLSTLKVPDQEKALVQICEQIKAAVNVIQGQRRSEEKKSTEPEAVDPAVTGEALKPASARRASKPEFPRRRTKPVSDRRPSVPPVITAQTEAEPLLRRPRADDELESKQYDREQRNFILIFDKDLSIHAEYSGIRIVEGLITLDRLHLELLGIFEDWLHNGKITRRLEMEVFGSLLYQKLFTGDVGGLFEEALHRTFEHRDEQLRLRLRFKNPDLEPLPWEFLYKPGSRSLPGFFLAISNRLTLSRYQPTPIIRQGREFEGRLRILLVVSNPSDLSAIRTEPLIDALQDLARRHSLELAVLHKPTPERFLQEFENYRPHVVHFIGHARSEETGTGSIALMTDDGRTSWIRDREFAELFRGSNVSLRLLILHKDGGSTFGSHLMYAQVDNVVELRYRITNTAALTFCRAFYTAMATGETLDVAVQRARASMSQPGPGSGDSLYFASPAYYASSAEPKNLVCQPDIASARVQPPSLGRPALKHDR